MERHNCKLCLKNFSNGRALGGHMRSHMLVASIHEQPLPEAAASSSSSSDEEDQSQKALYHGLGNKSKRSICMVDPAFSFAANTTTTTCVVQDDESETESSKTTRRRSKRSLKFMEYSYVMMKEEDKVKLLKTEDTCSNLEAEPVSSISDATTEEDLAFCLMMLSRDKWTEREGEKGEEEKEKEEESSKSLKKKGRGGKYRCETCKKLFKSYQALGGHRASHKKMKSSVAFRKPVESLNNQNKIHECPYCYRVFSSGQALGGHKRSHLITSSSAPTNNLIDLNLPAPTTDDDDLTQIELSALSDAEFLHHLM